MTKLTLPFTGEKIHAREAGGEVLFSSVAFTGRNAVLATIKSRAGVPPAHYGAD